MSPGGRNSSLKWEAAWQNYRNLARHIEPALRCFEMLWAMFMSLRSSRDKFKVLLLPSVSENLRNMMSAAQCQRDPWGARAAFCTTLTLANMKQGQAKGGFVVGTARDGNRIAASKDLFLVGPALFYLCTQLFTLCDSTLTVFRAWPVFCFCCIVFSFF